MDTLKNNVSKQLIILISSVLLLFTTLSYAQEQETVNKASSVAIASMVASPNACELSPLEEYCEMTFHIIWESPVTSRYCLYADDDSPAIQCWNKSKRGSAELKFSGHILDESKSYILINRENGITVTTVSVPISGTLKQRQRAQRRRRGFWRMF